VTINYPLTCTKRVPPSPARTSPEDRLRRDRGTGRPGRITHHPDPL